MSKKSKNKEAKVTIDDIIDKFDGEIVANENQDPVDYDKTFMFDNDVLDIPIIITGLAFHDELPGDFGIRRRFIISAIRIADNKQIKIMTEHAWLKTVYTHLEETKKPLKCMLQKIIRQKDNKPRYFLSPV